MPASRPLDADELGAYFALMEVSSLLRYAVEQHLRHEGGLSYVQFEILARLSDSPCGQQRMTDLADGVVYSRAGLTYQVEQMEKAGLITRTPSAEDERSVTATITPAGRELLGRVFPGHIELVRQMLFAPLSQRDLRLLTSILGRLRDEMRSIPPRSARPRRRRDTAANPARRVP